MVVGVSPHTVPIIIIGGCLRVNTAPACRAVGDPAKPHGDEQKDEGQFGEDVGSFEALHKIQAHGVCRRSEQLDVLRPGGWNN